MVRSLAITTTDFSSPPEWCAVQELGGYLQVFRNGAIEAFDSTMLPRQYTGDSVPGLPDDTDEFAIHPLICAVAFENALIDALIRYIRLLMSAAASD